MPKTLRVLVCIAVAVRLLLAWTGIGRSLAWRVEVSTAANSNLELREGLALYDMGVSPYRGSSCRVPPLVLWLYGALAEHDVLYVLPNTLFDVLAALLLYRLALRLLTQPPPALPPSAPAMDTPSRGPGVKTEGPPAFPVPALLAAAYLLNPLSLLASAAGTTAPLEGLAVAAALYGSVVRRPALAAAGLAVAGYLSLHALVLLLPIACLLAYGAEYGRPAVPVLSLHGADVGSDSQRAVDEQRRRESPQAGVRHAERGSAEREREGTGAAGEPAAQRGKAGPVAAAAQPTEGARAEADTGAKLEAAPPAPHGLQSRQDLPGAAPPATGSELLPWRTLRRCGGLLLAWVLLLALLSDLYLLPLLPARSETLLQKHQRAFGAGGFSSVGDDAAAPPPTCLVTALDELLFSRPWPSLSSLLAPSDGTDGRVTMHGVATAAPSAAFLDALRAAAAEAEARLGATRGSLRSCWAVRVYGTQILLDDATPNVGQWWYLAMEAFDDAKAYIRILAHSLLLALAPPLALRLGPRRPLALFLLQLLALALLKPYPSVADLGLATSLLPLLLLPLPPAAEPPPPPSTDPAGRPAPAPPAPAPPGLLLPGSLALLCVLGPSMLRMWLSYESANSNFAYSATLLYGVWQVVLLAQLLGWVLRSDRAARGKVREADEAQRRTDGAAATDQCAE